MIRLSPWEFVRRRLSDKQIRNEKPLSGAEQVMLPHTWNATDTFQSGVKYVRGWGSYQTTFELDDLSPTDWLQLEAGGFYGTGDIWLNGQRLQRFDAAWLGFHLNLVSAARVGHNVLTIRLRNDCDKDVLPGIREPDFLLHGGLSAPVTLEKSARGFLDRRGALVQADLDTKEQGRVRIGFDFHHAGPPETALDFTLDISDAEIRSETRMLQPGRNWLEFETRIPDPIRWALDQPHLYTATLTSDAGHEALFRFGFRGSRVSVARGIFSQWDAGGTARHQSARVRSRARSSSHGGASPGGC